MTFKPTLVDYDAPREGYWAINPVTGQPEAFVAIQSSARNFQNFPSGSLDPYQNAESGLFATAIATGIADPFGGFGAKRWEATTANAFHAIRINPLVNADGANVLLPGEPLAFDRWVKFDTGSPITQFDQFYTNGAGVTIQARFDAVTGARISGDARMQVEVPGLDNPDPVLAGWLRPYTEGLNYAAVPTGALNLDIRMVKSGNQSFVGATGDTILTAGGSIDIKRGYQWPGYPGMGNWQIGRQPDRIAVGLGRFATPQAMTVNFSYLDRGNRYRATNIGVCRVGDHAGTASGSINLVQNGTTFTATYTRGSQTSVSTLVLETTTQNLVEVILAVNGSGALQLSAAKDADPIVTGTLGNPIGLPPAWSGPYLHFGSLGASGFGDMLLRKNYRIIGGAMPAEYVRGA